MDDPVTGLPLAGFWRRLGGYLIDSAVLSAAAALLFVALGPRAYVPMSGVLSLAYWVGFIGSIGATPGMRLVRERVARADTGFAPTWGDAIVRFLGMLVSGLTLNLGYLWVAVDGRKQGLHDHLARTVVILDA